MSLDLSAVMVAVARGLDQPGLVSQRHLGAAEATGLVPMNLDLSA